MRERAQLRNGAPEVVACPFKGLASFDVDDAEFFFGRERLVAEMVARLGGRAADGRSSGRRAAASPRRCAPGCCPRSPPACCPAASAGRSRCCARASTRCARSSRRPPTRAPRGRLVVAVDQFEEVFTACRDEGERAAFVDALVARARATRAGGRSCWSPCAPTSTAAAPPTRSCARLLGANHVPRRPDAPRRAAPRDRAARAARRPARRAGPRRRADRRRRGRAGRAAAAVDRRCSSCGSSATGGACA